MKIKTVVMSVCLIGAGGFAMAGEGENCVAVAKRVAERIGEDSTRVLLTVEDAVIANEACACEIVKAAILASKADGELVRQIVFTAASAAPAQTALIAECALSVAPEAASEIRAALESLISSKSTGNVVPAAVPASEGFRASPAGIFMVQPAAGFSGGVSRVVREGGEGAVTDRRPIRLRGSTTAPTPPVSPTGVSYRK
jgi:hypothetical protein